jgi:epoxyqueuosine reductase
MTEEIIRPGEDYALTIIPAECFADIKADIEIFRQRDDLNRSQKWITFHRYILDVPELPFETKSIVITAIPFVLKTVRMNHRGKTIEYICDLSRDKTKEKVKSLLRQSGYQFKSVEWLPQKRLSVRAGLTEYGRNNIVYTEKWGSLIELDAYFSDIPFKQDYVWREVVNMELCDTCPICTSNCPTGAILKDRFLIDNQMCLTAINETGTDDFPEWVPKSAHRRLVGCMRCQELCPKNKSVFERIEGAIEFSDDETEMLLSGTEYEELPPELAAKVDLCEMKRFYKSIPRNLRALLDNSDSLRQ